MSPDLEPAAWLLESESFTDLVVKCGPRTWNLHKAVLCCKSKWFIAALNGNFHEAQSGCITINDENPEMIDHMIEWIYNGYIDAKIFEDDDKMYSACVELYKVSDYFLLPELAGTVFGYLKVHLQRKATKLRRQYYRKPSEPDDKTLFTRGGLHGIHEGINMAWKLNLEPLKELWIDFFDATVLAMLYSDAILEMISEVPALCARLLATASTGTLKPRHNTWCPSKCNRCGIDPHTRKDGYFDRVQEEDCVGYCEQCTSTNHRLFINAPTP
ncbi:hypothetical protein M426DRAFT_28591 [Hypoxylon sp. CI-4A]|nr:hypothetical protein M426DRAFT_28591 [Hypoxylon sp. CI-4A]